MDLIIVGAVVAVLGVAWLAARGQSGGGDKRQWREDGDSGAALMGDPGGDHHRDHGNHDSGGDHGGDSGGGDGGGGG